MRVVPPDVRARIKHLYLIEELPLPDIAKAVHMHRRTVETVLREDGVPKRGVDIPNIHRTRIDPRVIAEALELYRTDCFDITQLVERFGIGRGTIHRAITTAGLNLGDRGNKRYKRHLGRGIRNDARETLQPLIEAHPPEVVAKKLGLASTNQVHKLRRRWGISRPVFKRG